MIHSHMFITDVTNKQELLSRFSPEGLNYWRAVELEFNRLWYIVRVRNQLEDAQQVDVDASITTTVLVAEVEDVLNLCNSSAKSQRVKWVSALIPEYLSQSDGWVMEQISAIWSTEMPTGNRDGFKKSYFIETDCGHRYPTNPADDVEYESARLTLVQRLAT